MKKGNSEAQLRALDDAIAEQKKAVNNLERVVLKNMKEPTEAEQKALREKIARLEELLARIMAEFAKIGDGKPRKADDVARIVRDVAEREESAKKDRDQCARQVEELERRVEQRNVEVERICNDWKEARERLCRGRDTAMELKGQLDGVEHVMGTMRKVQINMSMLCANPVTYIQDEMAGRESVHFDRQAVEKELNQLQLDIVAERARQVEVHEKHRLLELSISRRQRNNAHPGDDAGVMTMLSHTVKNNVDRSGRVLGKGIRDSDSAVKCAVQVSKKMAELAQKVASLEGRIHPSPKTDVVEKNDKKALRVNRPKEFRRYGVVRSKAMALVDPREFKLFLMPMEALARLYQTCKANYEKRVAFYAEGRQSARNARDAAEVQYKMVMKRVTQAGLKPLNN